MAVSGEITGAGRPISSVLIIVATQTEVMSSSPNYRALNSLQFLFPKGGVPWIRYHETYKNLQINLVWPGIDTHTTYGVDSVGGTISASLVTYASIQCFKPDLIVNAETAGGFKAKGECISDVYLASDVFFHDRRIPIPVCKLSTGDSLDMSPQDEASILANGATLKDMEGAAMAYLAGLFSVPTILVKAVAVIVDGKKPTTDEYLQNRMTITAALVQSVTQVIDFINGKCLPYL